MNSCLVDGDAQQLASAHRLRRRSLLISVAFQLVVVAALILVPILSKTERIALANVMPMPPYHRPTSAAVTNAHPRPTTPTHGFSFCLTCPPVLPHSTTGTNTSPQNTDDPVGIGDPGPEPQCTGCIPLESVHPQPVIPPPPTPHIVHVTHIDPAMLTYRVEPAYPTLAHQTRREGTVELHAIIATDGSVRSLQVLQGDAMFNQSALDAVGQWRYKPTFLNGNPVEVDTHITVIYKFAR